MINKPEIDLSNPADIGLGLIIIWSSGVIYSHQVGGYSCLTAKEEGVFARLYKELDDQEAMFIEHFCGSKWNGCCFGGIDNETADFIDQVLNLSSRTNFIKVDRTRLDECCEAWIYVDINEPETSQDGYCSAALGGFGKVKGVLIWSNSD